MSKRNNRKATTTTLKQKKIAKAVVDNLKGKNHKTAQKMLEEVGYSKGIAKHPKRVLKSRGVKKELKLLGFDEDSAKKVVAEIMNKGKEENRLRATDQVFKVHGSYASDKKDESHKDEIDAFFKGIKGLIKK